MIQRVKTGTKTTIRSSKLTNRVKESNTANSRSKEVRVDRAKWIS